MGTVRWEGKAIPVKQESTITIAGTWVAADTVTVTMNGKALTLTVGTDVAVTAVALGIKEMWNGTAQSQTGYSASETGDNVPEFAEVTADSSAGVVTLVADSTVGKPFTVATTKVSTAGTVADATTVNADGPHQLDSDNNWDTGSAPTGADDVVWDDGFVDVLYGLDAFAAIQFNSITIEKGYTGKIGLPLVNVDGTPYPEYRERYCKMHTTGSTCNVNVGGGDGTGSSRLFFDFGSGQVAVNVTDTATPEATDTPTFTFIGTNSSNTLTITKGSVGCAVIAGEICDVANISTSFDSNQASDVDLVLGPGVDMNSTVITQNGGTIVNECSDTLPELDLLAGIFTHRGGPLTLANCEGGTLSYETDQTLAELIVGSNATADFSKDLRSKTVSKADVFENGTIKDPAKVVTWSAGIDVNHTTLDGVTLDIGTDVKLTIGATTT